MSYQVKRSLGSLSTGALVLALYCVYALRRLAEGTEAPGGLGLWARAMLLCMGAAILAMIATQILFHILYSIGVAVERRESDGANLERAIEASMIEDELDELVELKALRLASILPALGFVAALAALALGAAPELALNLAFLAFLASPVAVSLAQLFYYRASAPHA